MLDNRPNIVQAEFFHVNFDESCVQNIVERVAEKGSSKTVIRFYEIDKAISTTAQSADEAEKLFSTLIRVPECKGLFRRFRQRRALRKTVEAREKFHAALPIFVKLALAKVIKEGGPVAVEQLDYSFRLAQPDELHELQEAVGSSRRMWLFLMRPNELLADKQSVFLGTF